MQRITQISLDLKVDPSAIHKKLHLLDELVKAAARPHRDTQRVAVTAVQEIFSTYLLPKDRPLKELKEQPILSLPPADPTNAKVTKKREELMEIWKSEDKIKRLFSSFLSIIENGLQDAIESQKNFFLNVAYNVLSSTVEQETKLLRLLVNKMGDPIPKLASKVVHLLSQLLQQHPRMQYTVAVATEEFLFRTKSTSPKAKYYAILVLSEMRLTKHDAQLVHKLLDIYFTCFKQIVKTSDAAGSNKMMKGLLTGVRRAFPYSDLNMKEIQDHIDFLFRICFHSAFTHRVSALYFLLQVCVRCKREGRDEAERTAMRYYSALYTLVGDLADRHNVPSASSLAVMFTLIYKSLSTLTHRTCVLAFVHRILQICLFQSASFTCACLILISELIKVHAFIPKALKENLEHAPIQEETQSSLTSTPYSSSALTRKQQIESGIVPEAEAQDVVAEPPKKKRKKEVEVEKETPAPPPVAPERRKWEKTEKIPEFAHPALLAAKANAKASAKAAAEAAAPKKKPAPKPVVEVQEDEAVVQQRKVNQSLDLESRATFYDANARNPFFSGANMCSLWVLDRLRQCTHPSIIKFTCALLCGEPVEYEGDPLSDFAPRNFVEQFITKKPKAKFVQTIEGVEGVTTEGLEEDKKEEVEMKDGDDDEDYPFSDDSEPEDDDGEDEEWSEISDFEDPFESDDDEDDQKKGKKGKKGKKTKS